jgi:preprotein translocase subunit SecA
VQQPAFAEIGAEPEEAMAEEMRATGTTGRPSAARPRAQRRPGLVNGNGADRNGADRGEPQRLAGPRAPWAGTPRNAPCPCGSGRKFKHCHGRV